MTLPRLALSLAPYALALALSAGLWLHGRNTGLVQAEAAQARALAKLQADLDEVGAANRAAAATILAAREAQATLSEALENEARANPDACRIPRPDSLRRLERRWQGAAP
jgi:pantothenate synthetase